MGIHWTTLHAYFQVYHFINLHPLLNISLPFYRFILTASDNFVLLFYAVVRQVGVQFFFRIGSK